MNSLSMSLREIFVAIDASGEGFVSEDQMKASFDRLNVTMNTEQHRELAKVLKTGDDNLECMGSCCPICKQTNPKAKQKGEEKSLITLT